MILLDTCTLLWMTSEPGRLSEEVKDLMSREADSLFVSAISAFEIGVKARKGHLKLPQATARWFQAALEFHGVSDLPVSVEIAIRSTELPLLHRDPCDRILVATAQIHDLILITPDPLIRQYSGTKTIW